MYQTKGQKMPEYYLLAKRLAQQRKLMDDLLLGKQETFLLACLEEMAFSVNLCALLTCATIDLAIMNLIIYLIHHNCKTVLKSLAHIYKRTGPQLYQHWEIGLCTFLQEGTVRNLVVEYLIGEVQSLPARFMGSRAN